MISMVLSALPFILYEATFASKWQYTVYGKTFEREKFHSFRGSLPNSKCFTTNS